MPKGTLHIVIRDDQGNEFHRHTHDVDDIDAAADHVAELEPEDNKSDRSLMLGGDRRKNPRGDE